MPKGANQVEMVSSVRGRHRFLAAGAGVVLSTMLVAAAMVSPDQRGFGTHEQFGLPPCASRWLWDGRCPACGMTTAWAWSVRGRFVSGWNANGGGVVLFAGAVVGVLVCGWMAAGRAVPGWLGWAAVAWVWVGFVSAVATTSWRT